MSTPLLTVCIPAYNQPGFLREALESLCDQGLDRGELAVIVSDDASPTPLEPVVAAFGDRLQIVYDRAVSNRGHIANYVHAFERADSPWVTFLPHDDVIAPGHFGRALAALTGAPDVVLVSSLVLCQPHAGALETTTHGFFPRGAAKASYSRPYAWDTAEWMALSLVTTPLSIVGSLFEARAFKECEHWTRYPLWHDRLMLAEVALHGRVISLPWIAGAYRTGEGRLSGALWQSDMAEFRTTSELILGLCRTAGIDVTRFWIEQVCDAAAADQATYLTILARALPAPVFADIKGACERRLGRPLHLDPLQRAGVPSPLVAIVRAMQKALFRTQR